MAAQQLHASFPSSFSWLLPKHLAAAKFAIFSSYSQKIAAYPSHTHTYTHTLLHIPLRERGGWLHDVQFCSHSPWFCPGAQGSFTFSSAIPSVVHFGKKLSVTCASPLPPTSFPLCLSFLSQGGLPNAAVLLQQSCIPRRTVTEFCSISMAPALAGVPLLLCCTLRICASTFSGCMLQLMWEVEMFICPVE